jgi:hypothetical protein
VIVPARLPPPLPPVLPPLEKLLSLANISAKALAIAGLIPPVFVAVEEVPLPTADAVVLVGTAVTVVVSASTLSTAKPLH